MMCGGHNQAGIRSIMFPWHLKQRMGLKQMMGKSFVVGWRITGRAECKYCFISMAIMTQNVCTSLGIHMGCRYG
jgi:hypothetical protein